MATRVRSWTPLNGPYHGFLITHSEAISIADYFAVRKDAQVLYRPTVHYAYHPSDAAVLSVHEFCGRNYQIQDRKRIMMDDITKGIDELGVLLAGHKKNAYWYGSQLSIEEARALAPYNNATSLQVTAAVLAGMVWAMENPNNGITEPDEMDFRRTLAICTPVSRAGCGAVHRLDAAERSRTAVPRGSRSRAIPGSSRTCASARRRGLADNFGVVDLDDGESGACRRRAPA